MCLPEPSKTSVPDGAKEATEKNLSPKNASNRRQGALWQIKEPDGPWGAGISTDKLAALEGYTYSNNIERTAKGLGGWTVVAGTRRGRVHANEGSHREDAFDYLIGEDIAVFAVCDGAGASKLSRIGSEFTARRAVKEILNRLTTEKPAWEAKPDDKPGAIERIVRETVTTICAELENIAREAASEAKDFRCTLLLLIHFSSPSGDEFWSAQIGDGFIGAENSDGAERWGASDSGDFSGEVGCFVPDPEAPAQAQRTLSRKDGSSLLGVALASDGIEDPFFPVPKHLGAIFQQLRGGVDKPLPDFSYTDLPLPGPVTIFPAATAELAKWLAFEKRGENDDRTILVIYRQSGH